MNRALAAARGELIGILDGDDTWPPDRIRRQVALLDCPARRRSRAWGHGDRRRGTGRTLHPSYFAYSGFGDVPRGRILGTLLRQNVVAGGASLFRASLRDRILPLAEELVYPRLADRGARRRGRRDRASRRGGEPLPQPRCQHGARWHRQQVLRGHAPQRADHALDASPARAVAGRSRRARGSSAGHARERDPCGGRARLLGTGRAARHGRRPRRVARASRAARLADRDGDQVAALVARVRALAADPWDGSAHADLLIAAARTGPCTAPGAPAGDAQRRRAGLRRRAAGGARAARGLRRGRQRRRRRHARDPCAGDRCRGDRRGPRRARRAGRAAAADAADLLLVASGDEAELLAAPIRFVYSRRRPRRRSRASRGSTSTVSPCSRRPRRRYRVVRGTRTVLKRGARAADAARVHSHTPRVTIAIATGNGADAIREASRAVSARPMAISRCSSSTKDRWTACGGAARRARRRAAAGALRDAAGPRDAHDRPRGPRRADRRLDDDGIALPDRIARQVAMFDRDAGDGRRARRCRHDRRRGSRRRRAGARRPTRGATLIDLLVRGDDPIVAAPRPCCIAACSTPSAATIPISRSGGPRLWLRAARHVPLPARPGRPADPRARHGASSDRAEQEAALRTNLDRLAARRPRARARLVGAPAPVCRAPRLPGARRRVPGARASRARREWRARAERTPRPRRGAPVAGHRASGSCSRPSASPTPAAARSSRATSPRSSRSAATRSRSSPPASPRSRASRRTRCGRPSRTASRSSAVHNRPHGLLDLGHPAPRARRPADPQRRSPTLLDRVDPHVVHLHNLHNLGLSLVDETFARGIRAVFSTHNYWLGCARNYLFRDDLSLCDGPGGRGAPARRASARATPPATRSAATSCASASRCASTASSRSPRPCAARCKALGFPAADDRRRAAGDARGRRDLGCRRPRSQARQGR